eukprot:366227-Chlamydomonas_euryale.AAC.17
MQPINLWNQVRMTCMPGHNHQSGHYCPYYCRNGRTMAIPRLESKHTFVSLLQVDRHRTSRADPLFAAACKQSRRQDSSCKRLRSATSRMM